MWNCGYTLTVLKALPKKKGGVKMKGKRISILVMAMLLVAAMFLPTMALAETVKTQYSDGSLVVRGGPGTNYEPASWVKNGQSITVLEKGDTWSKIRVDSTGKTGYIKTRYIAGSSSALPDGNMLAYELGTVTTRYASSRVNLRKGAGTGYGVVTSLGRGTELVIKDEQGNWYKVVTMQGTEGWISKNYVADGVSAKTTANVNLRKGAGTSNSVIKVLAKGTGVTALAVDGNWTKVQAGNSTGWIYSRYIQY